MDEHADPGEATPEPCPAPPPPQSLSERGQRSMTPDLFLAVGGALVLSLAVFDVAAGLLHNTLGLREPLFLATWLGAAFLAIAVVYLALGVPVYYALRWFTPATGARWFLALNAAAGLAFALARTGALDAARTTAWFTDYTLAVAAAIPLLAAAAVLVLLGAYYAVARFGLRGWIRVAARGFGFTLPFALAAATCLLWLLKREPGATPMLGVAAVVLAAPVAMLLAAFATLGLRPASLALLGIAGVLVLAIPFAGAFVEAQRRPEIAPSPGFEPAPRHVLLIVVDTLRADALSCYGAAEPTPHIDRLAADGLRFTRAIANAPWTIPSMASMLTGLSPLTHGTVKGGRLPAACSTVAEILVGAGYYTAAIGDNPFLRPDVSGFDQGFGQYTWFPRPQYAATGVGCTALRWVFPGAWAAEIDTAGLTTRALAWFSRNKHRPAFLWLHYFDPHLPYAPPLPFNPKSAPPAGLGPAFPASSFHRVRMGDLGRTPEERDWIRNLYLAEVRYVDAQVGRLIDGLKAHGIYDDALIILTSDHGEELWDHGGFEHGHTFYQELLHVPLIIKLPGNAAPSAIEAQVSPQNLAQTVLDVCSVPDGEGASSRAPSLQPLWRNDGAAWPEQAVVSAFPLYFAPREAITFQQFRYLRDITSGAEWLYDLVADPAESRNLAAEQPGRRDALRNALDAAADAAAREQATLGIAPESVPSVDPATLEALRSVGYL